VVVELEAEGGYNYPHQEPIKYLKVTKSCYNTNMKTLTHITHHTFYAAAFAAASVLFLFMLATAAEPQLTHGQADTADFTIRQTITDETSFSVPPSNIIMDGSINGLTGGQATGSSQFVVQTNNAAGYRVDISFEDNATPNAMVGDTSGSLAIRNYDSDAGGQPSFGYIASTTASLFAYTVTSTTTTDTAQSFLENGAVCNSSGGDDFNLGCWKSPSTTPFTVVQRGSSAVTGATSTVLFNVTVPNSAFPVPEAETYTATATLSLFTL
jgi:hypothetical protein